jgi:hypothetical protein
MHVDVIVGAVIASGITAAVVALIHKLASPGRCELISAEWLSRFSVAKYRPMERLLSPGDFRFLSAQKGYRPKIARRLRMERVRVYRGYLKCLRADYRKLEAAVGLWMAHSAKDRPEMALDLVKRRIRFHLAMAAAQWRLILFGLNMAPPSHLRLVDNLDDLRVCLRRAAMVRQASLS